MAVISLGSMNLDHVYGVAHFVAAGETILSSALKDAIGGKGLNQSIALTRSGAKVLHTGRLGVGGEPLRDFLVQNGVDVSIMESCGAPQGHTVIQLTPQGQNSIIVFGGSNREIDPTYIDRVLDQAQRGDYLVMQNEISGVRYAVEAAVKRGLKVVLNASPVTEELRDIPLEGIAWLCVNEDECAALAGCEGAMEALDALSAKYPRIGILLTLGSEGSVVRKDGQTYRQQAFRVKAVDTTGAGDTYTGFFVGMIDQGKDIPTAMRIAAKASAMAVTHLGAAESIPQLKDVMDALEA